MSFDDAAKFDMGATLITSPIGSNTGYQRDYLFKPHTSYCKYLRIEDLAGLPAPLGRVESVDTDWD